MHNWHSRVSFVQQVATEIQASRISHGNERIFRVSCIPQRTTGCDMTVPVKKLKPGILVAVGAVMIASLAYAVKRATDFDLDLDLNWDDLPA